MKWLFYERLNKQLSVSPLCPVPSRRPGSTGPSCWARAALPGPPGPYWSLEVKIPPPTHSRIFASQSVLERCIGVMRFLKQLVWMFSLIDSQFLQSFMLWSFSTLNTRTVKVNFKFRLTLFTFLTLVPGTVILLSLRCYNRLYIYIYLYIYVYIYIYIYIIY